MRIGYNTNGFAHHRLEDAIALLAEIGYRSIAITLDHYALNPYDPNLDAQIERARGLLEDHELGCVIETGSRFLLDPRHKHSPTLLDDPRDTLRRRELLIRAIDIAAALKADAVSFWSGAAPPDCSDEHLMDRLAKSCQRLLEHAERRNLRLAFEPEPGMFIDTMTRFAELHARVAHPLFGLTLDVGHVHCLDDGDPAEHIRAWHAHLFNVHIEDMTRGTHDHLMFGEGQMDFAPILRALRDLNYGFGLHVELSRHSHDAVSTARRAYAFLTSL
jgi:L-ribulose-5-phosphate 3-epimerase